jgi:hypothetical protein
MFNKKPESDPKPALKVKLEPNPDPKIFLGIHNTGSDIITLHVTNHEPTRLELGFYKLSHQI